MAIAGDSHHQPCRPIRLNNRGQIDTGNQWVTNKPRELIEFDIQRAIERLLAGERFEMYCSGPQIIELDRRLNEQWPRLLWWRVERLLIRWEKAQGWR